MWADVMSIAWPPAWSWFLAVTMCATGLIRPVSARSYRAAMWITAAIGCVIGDALLGAWLAMVLAVVNLIIGIALWWWRRKGRKRAAALLGAKSRAIRDAIVKRAKDASRGARPVLRPSLRGVS